MAKLDRLGWAAGASGTCFGVRVGVRVSDSRALPEALRRLPPGFTPSASDRVDRLYSLVVGGEGRRPGVRRLHLVYADARLVLRTAVAEQAIQALESEARLHLLANSVPARRRLAEVLATLSRVVRAATVLIGVRGEAGEAAGRLLTREATWADGPS